MSTETVAVAVYAGFLMVLALGFETLGRHANHRPGRFRTEGFTYRPNLDLWECPEGHHLHPAGIDPYQGVARYRAKAVVCNNCPVKSVCTDSHEGREVFCSLDAWPQMEAGNFHRGMSIVSLGLASAAAAIGIIITPAMPDLGLLGPAAIASLGFAWHLSRAQADPIL